MKIKKRGYTLVRDPLLNKGSAFTLKERAELGLDGLLPESFSTIEIQERRAYRSIHAKQTDMEKYLALANLQDRNEHLYYRLLGKV